MNFNPFRSYARIHPSYQMVVDSLLDDRSRPVYRPSKEDRSSTVLRWALPFLIAGSFWACPKVYRLGIAWLTRETVAIQQLESDMTAMKKIVAGIVPAVRQLADGKREVSSDGADGEPKLAVVITSRANIRREPALDASAIMTINEGSVLLIRSSQGEWVQVLTPLGEPGWMHRSVLRVE